MNTKHTPGPWHIDRDALERAARLQGGDNMRLILRWDAFARRGSAETEANARLIAAAPDLLEALYIAEAALEAYSGGEASDLEAIREAIAKATGNTNL